MDDHTRACIAPGDMMVVSRSCARLRSAPNRITDMMLSRDTVVVVIGMPVKVNEIYYATYLPVIVGCRFGWINTVFLRLAEKV